MAPSLLFIVVLCLSSGLWTGANAADLKTSDDSCKLCPPGWTLYDQKCYMFHHSEMEWADAEHFCTTHGANLASIHTSVDYELLRNTVERVIGSHIPTWVGGHDAVKEGVWMWSDGSKFDYKGWHEGQPDNLDKKEHCMEINFKGEDFVNDTGCNQKKSFICVKCP